MKAQLHRTIAIITILLGFAAGSLARAQQRGPSTAEERARAVRIAHSLEQDPLGKSAKDEREWVIRWIVEIPDITVNVCSDYFGKLPETQHGHSTEIARQMIISSAAFMIEHPDKAKDEQAIAYAGLLGSIKSYQAILKQDSAARWAQLDKLVQMRDQGKLDDFVSDTRRKCSQDQEEPDPDTMRAEAR